MSPQIVTKLTFGRRVEHLCLTPCSALCSTMCWRRPSKMSMSRWRDANRAKGVTWCPVALNPGFSYLVVSAKSFEPLGVLGTKPLRVLPLQLRQKTGEAWHDFAAISGRVEAMQVLLFLLVKSNIRVEVEQRLPYLLIWRLKLLCLLN
jgi:hypothetical protein